MSHTVRYDDRAPRLFFLAAVVWAVVGMLVGVLIAAMLFMPALNLAPYLTFGRLRPLHTNAVIFAFCGNIIFGGVYHSIQRLLALPEHTRLYLCHDYPPRGRDQHIGVCTVADQRQHNIHVRSGITADAFVQMRHQRDAGLAMPRLILPSVQVNMRAGHMPPPDDNGITYLKLPVNAV
mgnify:CR=1 FL=1